VLNATPTPVGFNSGSSHLDFYVYEWIICETGEIFYVGKGRGKRAEEFHANNEYAERIRSEHETKVVIVKDHLSEEEALQLEAEEIVRICTETNWLLTNVWMPDGIQTSRTKSSQTPPLKFETAPAIYTTDVEAHYFGIKEQTFPPVDINALKKVYLVDRMMQPKLKESIYGGQYERYYEETCELLNRHGSKVLTGQFAKSITAWIYCGELSWWLYNDDQKKAQERIGRPIVVYHLVDVWRTLRTLYGETPLIDETDEIQISPVNNRVPLSSIPQFDDDMEALHLGEKSLEKGFSFYFDGEYEKTLTWFDKARSEGCISPTLFNYYAIIFRKLKDYDNEIDILSEAIERYQKYNPEIYGGHIQDFKQRRKKAIALWKKAKQQ